MRGTVGGSELRGEILEIGECKLSRVRLFAYAYETEVIVEQVTIAAVSFPGRGRGVRVIAFLDGVGAERSYILVCVVAALYAGLRFGITTQTTEHELDLALDLIELGIYLGILSFAMG